MRHVTWAQQLPDCPQHFFQEVIWNNGWDFGDNIFIFKDAWYMSEEGDTEDVVVHSQDVI